jgi:PAS domain S-box-containing protein
MPKTRVTSRNFDRYRSPLAPCYWRLTPFFLASVFLFQSLLGAQVKPIRRVLILNEVGTSYPITNLVDQGIRIGLDNSPYRIEFYREYMETIEFPEPAVQQQFRDLYLRKYQNRKPDVIITVGSAPLQFMAETHKEAFQGVPIIFCLPNGLPDRSSFDPDFTGVAGDVAAGATLASALRLLPDTRHVVVVGGETAWDRQQQAVVKEQLKPYADRLDIAYLTELTMADLQERLRHLSSHTLVLLAAMGQDATGTRFTSAESGPMIAAAANAPIFSLSDRFLNHGEIGGDVSSAVEQGKVAGGIARRILSGEKPQNIGIAKNATTYMFDWRALKQWGLREKDLPPGSILLNRQPSFWETYNRYVVTTVLVLLAQGLAILGLLWQRTRRKRTEGELRRSEEKFSTCFRESPLAITITRTSDFSYVEVNEAFEHQTGWRRDEVIGQSPFDVNLWLNPNQRAAFVKRLLAEGRVRDIEVSFRRKDGQIRTALGSAELIEVDGESCALSVIADVTERKMAEEERAHLSGRLIEAQEAERSRIARELHDDINQRLAMLEVNLKMLKEHVPASDHQTTQSIDDVCKMVSDLEHDIQALSHRLHSSKLEYLGLEAAVRGFCKEIAERQNVKIDFQCDAIPESLSDEISLCLFRVLQESVHNAVKYSGVAEVEVSLTNVANEIQLKVHDSGAGFDSTAARIGNGLGLTSMKERLRLVNGQLCIESKLHHGTTIIARVPFGGTGSTSTAAA